jgi:hypothetical protein
MSSFSAIIAISALLATVSAAPIQVRSTCGSAPSASGSQTPLQQPSGITTAAQCQTQCEANNSCQSFVFGLDNNADQCILYSVAAAQVPQQSGTNFVVYDKACTSVPAVVPTQQNPTGRNQKLAVRDTCGSSPAGSGSQTPLSQPSGITTASACQAQCEANASCQSFVFGMVSNADQCILYSVAAASVPTQSSTILVVFDKACTSVPAVVPTSSNPTGANTGSTSTSNTGSTTTSNQNQNSEKPARLTVRDTCGLAPVALSGNATPISTPANISSAADCKAQCQANSSCKSFEFGTFTQGGSQSCRIFNVAASAVPAPASGQSVVVYDVGCSV